MTFTLNTANYKVYFNLTGSDRIVSVAVSANQSVNVDVRPLAGAAIAHQQLQNRGGVVCFRVPAQHVVEIDASQAGVQVEVHDTGATS